MRGEDVRNPLTNLVCLAALGSGAAVTAIVLTSVGNPSALGAPSYWAWVLTGIQVLALSVAARGNSCGWLIGASVQFPWIAYAVMTAQLGFVPGCLVSGVVQAHGYMHRQSSFSQIKETTYAGGHHGPPVTTSIS